MITIADPQVWAATQILTMLVPPPDAWDRVPTWFLLVIIAFIALFGYGGGKTFLDFLKDRKKPAIEPRAVEMAEESMVRQRETLDDEASAASLARQAMVMAEDNARRLDDERQERKQEREDQNKKIARLERKIGVVTRAYHELYAWALDLVRRWPTVRMQELPPELPETGID